MCGAVACKFAALPASYSGILEVTLTHSQRRFDLRVAVFAALALLFAQIGAMTHAYAHLSARDQSSAQQSIGGSHEICGDCLNYAPLLSAAGSQQCVEVH